MLTPPHPIPPLSCFHLNPIHPLPVNSRLVPPSLHPPPPLPLVCSPLPPSDSHLQAPLEVELLLTKWRRQLPVHQGYRVLLLSFFLSLSLFCSSTMSIVEKGSPRSGWSHSTALRETEPFVWVLISIIREIGVSGEWRGDILHRNFPIGAPPLCCRESKVR